jgi:hypothetical protein
MSSSNRPTLTCTSVITRPLLMIAISLLWRLRNSH